MIDTRRQERRSSQLDKPPRTPFQRDRDRVLHCSALRRLAGVTQVVDPNEGQVFHNRLTHTLKVAQIGRRIAEKILQEQPELAGRLGELDPDVVETAALIHDMGHPPFGHVAERTLDDLVWKKHRLFDGYEGNAQSFRIVTKLAVRDEFVPGLDLTRATLNAVLKYPSLRSKNGTFAHKWGAYRTEYDEFKWARGLSHHSEARSLEAELMDWADDIAFSVHDLEDFYRAGHIPLDKLVNYSDEQDAFANIVFSRWQREKRSAKSAYHPDDLARAFKGVCNLILPGVNERFSGTHHQRAVLRTATSVLIDRYVSSTELLESSDPSRPQLKIPMEFKMEITMLKELTWHYVINNPALATQQFGKARIIKELFETFWTALASKEWIYIFPAAFHEEVEQQQRRDAGSKARLVADVISSMTDLEALRTHQRLTGRDPGSIFDRLP